MKVRGVYVLAAIAFLAMVVFGATMAHIWDRLDAICQAVRCQAK